MYTNIHAVQTQLLLILCVLILGCVGNAAQESDVTIDVRDLISKELGIDVFPLQVEFVRNSYRKNLTLPIPGGSTDGTLTAVLKGDPTDIASIVESTESMPNWVVLPVSGQLRRGSYLFEDGWPDSYIPFETTNGAYYFLDRQTESRHMQKEFHERPSHNVTIGILDLKNNRLYFRMQDT